MPYTTVAICSSGYGFDCDKFNAMHRDTDLCNAVKPMPDELRNAKSERRYHWANENWGTKWGTYETQAFPLGGDGAPIAIRFQSAWNAPKILKDIAEWLMAESAKFLDDGDKFDRITFVAFEPYDNSTSILLDVKGEE